MHYFFNMGSLFGSFVKDLYGRECLFRWDLFHYCVFSTDAVKIQRNTYFGIVVNWRGRTPWQLGFERNCNRCSERFLSSKTTSTENPQNVRREHDCRYTFLKKTPLATTLARAEKHRYSHWNTRWRSLTMFQFDGVDIWAKRTNHGFDPSLVVKPGAFMRRSGSPHISVNGWESFTKSCTALRANS